MKNRSSPPSTTPIDIDIPDNYVSWTLKNQHALPPFQWDNIVNELNWLNVAILTVPPLLTIYAILYVPLHTKTCFFSIFYYFVTGLGGFLFLFSCALSDIFIQVLPQVTTVYGLTGHTTPLSLSSMFWQWLALALLRARSGGGPGVTVPTTGTPTPTWTHTMLIRDSGILTSAGCSSNRDVSLVSLTSAT
jgi:hypothetical protein